MNHRQGANRPEQNRARPNGRHDVAAGLSLAGSNALWTRAEQQVPGWQSITLRLPPPRPGMMAFTIDKGSEGRPDQRAQLTLDSRTAELVRWEPFSSNNAGRRLDRGFAFSIPAKLAG